MQTMQNSSIQISCYRGPLQKLTTLARKSYIGAPLYQRRVGSLME